MPVVFNLLKTLAGHGYDVNAVAFSRDTKLLVSGGGAWGWESAYGRGN